VEFLSPIALILLFSVALLLVGWFVLSRFEALLRDKKEDQSLLLMQQQIDQPRVQLSQAFDNHTQLVQQPLGQVLGNVNERLKENSEILERTQQNLGERLDNAARVVGSVQKSLGGLEEANRKIYEVGKDIASLQEILRAPKLRGGLGEFFPEDLLAQILPTDHFAIQHAFRSGEKVDAVIKLGGSLRGHFGKFRDDFGLLGKHLSHAQSSYQSTERRLEQFGQRLLSADANQEFVEFRSYDRKMG
jgi:DNA anti-recombination protein RmuC